MILMILIINCILLFKLVVIIDFYVTSFYYCRRCVIHFEVRNFNKRELGTIGHPATRGLLLIAWAVQECDATDVQLKFYCREHKKSLLLLACCSRD